MAGGGRSPASHSNHTRGNISNHPSIGARALWAMLSVKSTFAEISLIKRLISRNFVLKQYQRKKLYSYVYVGLHFTFSVLEATECTSTRVEQDCLTAVKKGLY